MGVSSGILKFGDMELSVDVDKVDESISSNGYTYTIGIGTGFTEYKKGSVRR